MTRLRRLTAVLAVLALTLGGCGLPDRTDPKYVGPASSPSRPQDRPQEPPTAKDASNLSDLIVRYLMTSVGGNVTSAADQPDAVSETQARMKTFMTEAAAARWRPKPQSPLVVVQVNLKDFKETSTKAIFTEIGQLDQDGRLLPSTKSDADRIFEFPFTAESVNGQLRLSTVPDAMLLSVGGFQEWYTPQPIYFWEKDVDAPKLVPDLRYMPRVLPAIKRADEVMQWLVDGPSDWLSQVVDRLPSDIETKGSATQRDDRSVVVNFTSKARGKSPDDLRRLSSQIRWSLDGHPPVSLSFENSKDVTNDSGGYEDDNAAYVPGEPDQEKFVVVKESVRQSDITVGGPPALFGPSEWNTGVVSATINRAHTRAALVRRVGARHQLFVSADTGGVKYVDSGIVLPAGTTLSRPAWISRPAQRFLVADGTRLWAVTPPATAGEPAQAVIVNGIGVNDTQITNVSAFSVSPDGRRIALIVGKKAMVASLRFENGKLTLGEQRLVPNTLGDNQAVGWITETTLAIGGRPHPGDLVPNATYSLVSTSVDGTGEKPLPLLKPEATSAFTVTQLSARTNDPSRSLEQIMVLFEANQVGQVVYADNVGEIPLRNFGPTPDPSPTQGPSRPLSPFYAD